ncbi:nucleotidyltransferase family protein [Natronoflexus pectinivorans]|uniref:Nucleotidyltransferase-like protein n=1 Tax=Natronoflexus pectinivorans TaxID=682526 RepID=A0A4R2GJV3_9BACT|nr:sugar phosphate nucleotidyltransferase [Natronoflexus pectinivorans]TCO08724.1 nucleotidyltransferase-like protein [Natronoflexus pectinivorans]
MIFAAGKGTRLKPYTNQCPKALVKVGELTMLEIALRKLSRIGIERVVINVHHYAEQIIKFLKDYPAGNMEILISDERELLLDTGGGLLNAQMLFDEEEPILIYNVDVLTNAPIEKLIEYHVENDNLVSMMIQKRDASRFLHFDDTLQLSGWSNPKTGETTTSITVAQTEKYGFNGIHIIEYEVLDLITKTGAFPIVPEYLELSKAFPVKGWDDWSGEWFDIGTPEKLEKVNEFIASLSKKQLEKFF